MAPTVESIYPSDEATGVPLGVDLYITFDSEIDEVRAKNNIMIFGPDFDQNIGPDSVQWIDVEKGYNPFFLQSPGFKGDLQYDVFFDLLNTDNTVFSGLDYHSGPTQYKTRIKITPKKPLAPETQYTIYIIGDSDNSGRGISSRTVYSTQLGSNTGDGNIYFRGGYKGTNEDTIVVTITESGNIRTAEYEWYYESVPTLIYTGISSTKYRSLLDSGVELRFTGSNFQVGDTFSIKVYPPTYMTESFKYTFTTGTGSIVSIPSTTSTSVLGDISSSVDLTNFEVLSTSPQHKEMKLDPNNVRIIKITFNKPVNPATITDKSIKIVVNPSTGYDPTTPDIGRINKFIFVDGNDLYIAIQKGEES